MTKFDLLLHIGPYKTGSSSIQEFLSSKYTQLVSAGVLYPKSGRYSSNGKLQRGHTPLFHAMRLKDTERFQSQLDALSVEIRLAKPTKVILSSEVVSRENQAQDFYDLISQNLPGKSKELLLYVRRQDDLLLSRYSQRVKSGNLRWPKTVHNLDAPKYLDHRLRIEQLEQALPDFKIRIRSYDHDREKLVQKFIEQAKLTKPFLYADLPYLNTRPSWGRTAIKRYINVLPGPIVKPCMASVTKFDIFLRSRGLNLLEKVQAPLNAKQRREVLECYSVSNQWLADRYFDGKDPFST